MTDGDFQKIFDISVTLWLQLCKIGPATVIWQPRWILQDKQIIWNSFSRLPFTRLPPNALRGARCHHQAVEVLPGWLQSYAQLLARESVALPWERDTKPTKVKCEVLMTIIPLNKALVEEEMLLITTTCMMAFPGGTSGLFKFLVVRARHWFPECISSLRVSTSWCLLPLG